MKNGKTTKKKRKKEVNEELYTLSKREKKILMIIATIWMLE